MSRNELAELNWLALVGAVLLAIGASRAGALQFGPGRPLQSLCAGWAVMGFGFVSVVFGWRILVANRRFIGTNPGSPRRFLALGVYAPVILSILLCASSPLVYMNAERSALIQSVRQETPLKRAVADVCDRLFRDPDYILQIPRREGSSYYQVGRNDHVSIWADATGEAYWFDIADSLSSGGYVCVRPGIAISEAIYDFEFWTEKRDLIPMFENLYWWN